MRISPLFVALCVYVFSTSSAEAQTVPCSCMDGSSDGLVSNTDFLPFVMNWTWGDSILVPEEMGPGLCDPEGTVPPTCTTSSCSQASSSSIATGHLVGC